MFIAGIQVTSITQYNFIAKWQKHKECVMVPCTLTHTLTQVKKKFFLIATQ